MILVLNAGSSSLRYRLFDVGADGAPAGAVAGGLVERVGEPGSPTPDHASAAARVAAELDLARRPLRAVGHRVVHGGTRFRAPTVLDDGVVAAIGALVPLAPLHNPANLAVIEVARRLRPDVPHVAVFDTAFHATLPPAAATYALDADLAARHGIRRYGFHGTSHRFVSRATAALLDRPVRELNTVVLHLGNGASACAVAGGRSVETSMGLTPLEGLVMGTRVGDLDPAVTFHLARHAGLGLDEIEDSYTHRGGLRGLCGDSDLRAVQRRAADDDPAATLALDVYCHRIRKYLGAYHAVLGRLDAVAFTGGVGEHSAVVRARVLAGLEPLGIAVDPGRNAAPGDAARVISPGGCRVAVCVVPTDEERAIAEEVREVLAAVTGRAEGPLHGIRQTLPRPPGPAIQ
ncbi:MAG TPA: acetate kinase [Pilimelia sp.]|nr:acetate kinase [Pilimelia sp.]